MKILLLADEPSRSLWDYFSPDKVKDVELIISCGDLPAAYLEFLVTMCHAPVLYVPGNHDESYVKQPPEGCECIDGTMFCWNGLRIFGLRRYGYSDHTCPGEELGRSAGSAASRL